jgi:3-dehydrosphinganine reductase
MIKIILAGLLSLPCLLVAAIAAPVIAILSIPPLLLLIFKKNDGDKASTAMTMPDRVIIVGGSSGIGLAIAKECARQGIPKVTILARNQQKLDKSKKDIESVSNKSSTEVEAISVSVTDYGSVEKVANRICRAGNGKDKKNNRIVIFNCAGIPYTTEFENIPVDVYSQLVETNQLGAMYVTRAFLPHMEKGCIVLCSSAAGQVGIYGYSVYSSTKYALKGFAETLHAELMRTKPGVSIQVAFPIDTATPGYEKEKEMMPGITKILNGNAGVAQPEE